MIITFDQQADAGSPAVALGLFSCGTPAASPPECLAAMLPGCVELTRQGAQRLRRSGDGATFALPAGLPWRRLILVQLGDREKLDGETLRQLGGGIATQAAKHGETSVDILLGEGEAGTPAFAAEVAYGARLGAYRFTRWRTRPGSGDGAVLGSIRLICGQPAAAQQAYQELEAIAEGVLLARDLVNEPANILTPAGFVDAVSGLADAGIKMQVLDEAELERLGMGGILAVGRGSCHAPLMLVLEYGERHASRPPICLVGKGVTFDSGGLNLKPRSMLAPMKGDMAGGAAVVGAMLSLARLGADDHVVGLIPLAENAVSGSSFRPSDVIRLGRGETVEIVDTDAEGRLLLADALWHARNRYQPRSIVSAGTLGGSAFFGLGLGYGGLYCDDPALRDRLVLAGERSGDRLWHLPADASLDEDLRNSDVADYLQAVDYMTYGADSAYIVRLLQNSVADTPWAHIEMARLEFAIADRVTCPKGATGYGAALLHQALRLPPSVLSPTR